MVLKKDIFDVKSVVCRQDQVPAEDVKLFRCWDRSASESEQSNPKRDRGLLWSTEDCPHLEVDVHIWSADRILMLGIPFGPAPPSKSHQTYNDNQLTGSANGSKVCWREQTVDEYTVVAADLQDSRYLKGLGKRGQFHHKSFDHQNPRD